MNDAGIVIVWEYRVPAAQAAQFEQRYGDDGDWVRLFRCADGFLGTQLLRDAQATDRYVTLDRWRSASDFAAFKARFAAEYAALDAQCEALTAAEQWLGTFVAAPRAASQD